MCSRRVYLQCSHSATLVGVSARREHIRAAEDVVTYDDWKLESPEDELESISQRKRRERAEWEEEHADYLLEDRRERRAERDFDGED